MQKNCIFAPNFKRREFDRDLIFNVLNIKKLRYGIYKN